MYCAQCGTSNEPGGQTCETCGAPLSPRSGPETCPTCNAPIATFDRYCQSCGAELAGAADDATRYEAGPSFVDDEPLAVSPSELPPWLRDLAAATPPPPQAESAHAEPEETLPDWLRASRVPVNDAAAPPPIADPGPTEAAPVEALSLGDEFSLIGDDDLPEWLRALGDEELPAANASTPGPGGTRAPTAAVLDVPSISRAWLTTPRVVDSDAQGTARPDFFPTEYQQAAAPTVAPTEPDVPEVVSEPDTAVASTASERTRRTRLLLVALLVVAILLLIYYLAVLR